MSAGDSGTSGTASVTPIETAALVRWQRRLLPLMTAALVVLGAFFLVESVRQMQSLQSYIRETGKFDPRVVPETQVMDADLRARVALEVYTLQQRERLANYMLVSRTWTRYMAFVTGMVLALVGAAFVLGKLRDPQTKLGAYAEPVKLSLATSSPGLVLAALGTLLMVTAIAITFDVTGRWQAVYMPVSSVTVDSAGEPALPRPAKAESGATKGTGTLPSYRQLLPGGQRK
jgi:hypothetical protein